MKKRILTAKDLGKILKTYEAKYGMNSQVFSAKFNRGELPENLDFLQWITYYDMASKAGLIDKRVTV